MARAPSLAGVILAAGSSSRMQREKALLPWKGRTLLTAGIELLTAFTELVIVVAGENARVLEPVVDASGAFLVTNPHPEQGQFSSLQVGVQEVLNRGRDAAAISLVDHPPVQRETLASLRSAFDGALLAGKWGVVPEFEGRHGHPILVARELITAFLQAPSTTTAREVIRAHQRFIQYVAVTDRSVILNLDTPEDYKRITDEFSPSPANGPHTYGR